VLLGGFLDEIVIDLTDDCRAKNHRAKNQKIWT